MIRSTLSILRGCFSIGVVYKERGRGVSREFILMNRNTKVVHFAIERNSLSMNIFPVSEILSPLPI